MQDKVIFSCKNQQLSRESHLSSKGITIHFNPLWILTLGFLRTDVPPGVSSPVFLSMVIDVFQLLLWHFLKYICVCGKHTRYNPIPALSRLRILLLLSWAHILAVFTAASSLLGQHIPQCHPMDPVFAGITPHPSVDAANMDLGHISQKHPYAAIFSQNTFGFMSWN